jgi:hypothetical protein
MDSFDEIDYDGMKSVFDAESIIEKERRFYAEPKQDWDRLAASIIPADAELESWNKPKQPRTKKPSFEVYKRMNKLSELLGVEFD